jgi:lysozyme
VRIGANNLEQRYFMETLDRDKLTKQLVGEEDIKLSAYQDIEGFWTIAIGHLIDARKGGKITLDTAYYILNKDIDEKCADLDKYIPWWRNENEVRQRVMVDLCFNLGVGGLLGFHNTLAHWQRGEYDEATLSLLDSKVAKEENVNRYQKLAQMLKTGEDI